MFQWDDLKFFLATMRARSASQAAQSLGVSTSTVTRRLAVLEEQLGVVLFARTPEGLIATDEARGVARAAEQVERAAAEVESSAGSGQAEPAGLVRLACVPDVAQLVVIPALGELRARHPRLRLELASGTERADLGRREADLALRAFRPEAGELVARKLREVAYGIFGATDVLAAHLGGETGVDAEAAGALPWVGLDARFEGVPEARWLGAALPHVEPIVRASSLTDVRLLASAGLGLAVLPRLLAEFSPRLREVAWRGTPGLPSASLWIAGHESGYRTPRVRAVWDFLVSLCSDEGDEAARAAGLRRRFEQAYG